MNGGSTILRSPPNEPLKFYAERGGHRGAGLGRLLSHRFLRPSRVRAIMKPPDQVQATPVLQPVMAAQDEGGTHAFDNVEVVCSIQVSYCHHLNSCFFFASMVPARCVCATEYLRLD
jgi:hypothetical protein